MPYTDILDALAATPIILRVLIAGGLESRPAGDEGWTAREVIAHLRDCEDYRLRRCQAIVDEDEPFLAAFDQDELARERDYKSTDAGAALGAFEQFRRGVINLVTPLDDASWQRTAQHEELGRITLESQIRQALGHDMVHLRQIAESLRPPAR